ncbi:kinase-like domain-containing protein [Pelagophyceae sp. CCMP2097]|nr:kinase-like domain-containing protein [Pelagophyceae sp. CCMP2097]
MGVAKRDELSLLSFGALVLSLASGPTPTSAAYTLSKTQQRGLASMIHQMTFAGEHFAEDGAFDGDARKCIETLVQAADSAFSAEATVEERDAVWSLDDGVGADAVAALRRRVAARLEADMPAAARACVAGPSKDTAMERAAAALVNSCLRGRSAHFAAEHSPVDQFLSVFGWWSTLGVFLLALGGAYSFVDVLLAPLLLGADAPRAVPCACRICERAVVLSEAIGAGGFGAVWRCAAPKGCVLKLVRVDLRHDVNALRVVLEEAKHLLELQHAHIVAYYDIFLHRGAPLAVDRAFASGAPPPAAKAGALADYACLAMEDCVGGSLLDHIAVGVAFPLAVVATVTRQCADALRYAHARGIVHRDVKLENIFVKIHRGVATIKVGDFGLAVRDAAPTARGGQQAAYHRGPPRNAENDRPTLSAVGGTLAYQPPECFASDGAAVSPALDAWGLGCALYEMATCASLPTEPPFLGELLGDGATRGGHLDALTQRFDGSLDVAAAAAAARRDDSPRQQARRRGQLRGLKALLRQLLAPEARQRPSMQRVADLDFLKDDAPLDFFTAFSDVGSNDGARRKVRGTPSRGASSLARQPPPETEGAARAVSRP